MSKWRIDSPVWLLDNVFEDRTGLVETIAFWCSTCSVCVCVFLHFLKDYETKMNTDTLLQWRECEILYYTKYLTGCCMSHGKCISVYLLCTTKLLGPKLEALTSVEYGRGYCKHLTNDCQINPKRSVLHGFLLWKWSRLLLLAQVVLQSYKYLWKGIKIYNILPEVFSHPCKSLNSGVPNTFVAAFRRVQITEWGQWCTEV